MRIKRSDYWIGISCREADEVLQKQLKLSAGQGLVVQRVLDESPAAKAKLQQHDVLLQVGDRPLSKIRDLSGLIDQSKEEAITIDILRDGDRKSITITPQKRKESDSERYLPQGGREVEAFRRLAERLGGPDLKPLDIRPGGPPPRREGEPRVEQRLRELDQRVRQLTEELRRLRGPQKDEKEPKSDE